MHVETHFNSIHFLSSLTTAAGGSLRFDTEMQSKSLALWYIQGAMRKNFILSRVAACRIRAQRECTRSKKATFQWAGSVCNTTARVSDWIGGFPADSLIVWLPAPMLVILGHAIGNACTASYHVEISVIRQTHGHLQTFRRALLRRELQIHPLHSPRLPDSWRPCPLPASPDASECLCLTWFNGPWQELVKQWLELVGQCSVKTTHERCGPFSLVVLSQRRGRVYHVKWLPSKNAKWNTLKQASAKHIQVS